MRKTRIAILASHPIQYATPFYAYLNRDPRFEVTALFCTDFSLRGAVDSGFGEVVVWNVDLLAGYNSVFLGQRARTRSLAGFWSLVCPELVFEIRSCRFDVLLIPGHQYAACLLAFLVAKIKGVSVMTRCDTQLGLRRPWLKDHVRALTVRLQYLFVDRFLAIGTANREYYRAHGVSDSRIFVAPFCVDNDRFIADSDAASQNRPTYRSKLGIYDDRPVFLFVSKLQHRKHPDDLLMAAAGLAKKGFGVHVVIAGSGPMLGELKALAASLRLSNVTFLGFVNQAELPGLYAASDVFVFPSEEEPWGLVVNEAMCAALPIVVGRSVGCVPDLLREGTNGFACTPGRPDTLEAALELLANDSSLRREMGEESRRMISKWGYEECKNGFLRAIEAFDSA